MSCILVVNAPWKRTTNGLREYAQLSVTLTDARINRCLDFTSEDRASEAPSPEARVVMYAAYGGRRFLHPVVRYAGSLIGAGLLVEVGRISPVLERANEDLWTLSVRAYGNPQVLTHYLRYCLHRASQPLERSRFKSIDTKRKNFVALHGGGREADEIAEFWERTVLACPTCSE